MAAVNGLTLPLANFFLESCLYKFEAYLEVFLTRFYPLYTIVNKSELLEAHKRNTLPWIMLQGICLIGATFCDAAVIHRIGHKTRAQARKAYYGE